MKENVMDILRYLFESYINNDDDDNNQIQTSKEVQKELSLAGFQKSNIHKAFQWLNDLSELKQYQFDLDFQTPNAFRIYNEEEQERLSVSAIGFITYLENMGILNLQLREIVIERALALENDTINQEQMQWVALMVLFNISGSEAAFTWIEDIVFADEHLMH